MNKPKHYSSIVVIHFRYAPDKFTTSFPFSPCIYHDFILWCLLGESLILLRTHPTITFQIMLTHSSLLNITWIALKWHYFFMFEQILPSINFNLKLYFNITQLYLSFDFMLATPLQFCYILFVLSLHHINYFMIFIEGVSHLIVNKERCLNNLFPYLKLNVYITQSNQDISITY